MIPKAFMAAWRAQTPWSSDAYVGQDLILSRAIIEIFSDPFLRECLAFRGGTPLQKVCVKECVRYSEDIDLVQRHTRSIGR